MKIISWNVNGIRAVLRKGFLKWLDKEKPDILCLQETKASRDQLTKNVTDHKKYHSFWHSATIKKGYSGVVTFAKEEPLHEEVGFGIENAGMFGRDATESGVQINRPQESVHVEVVRVNEMNVVGGDQWQPPLP